MINEDTVRNPGGGAAYVAAAKKELAQKYDDSPWPDNVVAETNRMK